MMKDDIEFFSYSYKLNWIKQGNKISGVYEREKYSLYSWGRYKQIFLEIKYVQKRTPAKTPKYHFLKIPLKSATAQLAGRAVEYTNCILADL